MSQIIKPGTGGGGGGGIETIAGDVGSITGANATIYANQASNNSGGTVLFNNSGTVSTLNLTDSSFNTFLGGNSGGSYGVAFNTENTALGYNTLVSLTNGPETASRNVAVGETALFSLVGNALDGANDNTAIGYIALTNLVNGDQNLAIGFEAGTAYTTTESNNILLSNPGVIGENDTIRLGRVGGGDPHTANFQGGIAGVTVSNAVPVVIDSVTGQLGQGSPVYFQAYRTSNQSVAGGSTADTIIFDTAIANVGGAYNTGTGVFTAPSTGFYSFCSTVYFADLNVPSGLTQVILDYTGSVQSLRLIQQGIGAAVGGTVIILTVSFALPMTAGDTIQMQPFADGTGNYTIFGTAASPSAFNTSSTFAGYKVA